MKKILIVDDDATIRKVCKRLVMKIPDCSEDNINLASDASEALVLLECKTFDLMITDKDMPGMSGVELIQICAFNHPQMKVVLMTGRLVEDLSSMGIVIIQKPFEMEEFNDAIKKALI